MSLKSLIIEYLGLETTHQELSGEMLELYEERAAIMEFDGRVSRDVAEFYAKKDVMDLKKGRRIQVHFDNDSQTSHGDQEEDAPLW